MMRGSGFRNDDYVNYAVKLGYERRLALIALNKLGSRPSTDQFLRTVVKLKEDEKSMRRRNSSRKH